MVIIGLPAWCRDKGGMEGGYKGVGKDGMRRWEGGWGWGMGMGTRGWEWRVGMRGRGRWVCGGDG
jgi:hypothetical protein